MRGFIIESCSSGLECIWQKFRAFSHDAVMIYEDGEQGKFMSAIFTFFFAVPIWHVAPNQIDARLTASIFPSMTGEQAEVFAQDFTHSTLRAPVFPF